MVESPDPLLSKRRANVTAGLSLGNPLSFRSPTEAQRPLARQVATWRAAQTPHLRAMASPG